MAPADPSRSGGGRFLTVLTQLLHRPALFTPSSLGIKPVAGGSQSEGWEEAGWLLSGCLSEGFSYPAISQLSLLALEAARSLFLQPKGKWKERRLICPRVNQCWLQLLSECVLSKILAFTLHSSLDEGERATGTEFTRTTGIFIIPFLK